MHEHRTRLLLIRVLLFEELGRQRYSKNQRELTDLDEGLGGLEEMLFSLRLGTLCVPVDDCLIGNTVRVVQHLE
jgi:hypothetical protein